MRPGEGGAAISGDTITIIWLVAGAALMLAELAVPGGVIFFFGAAAALVAGLRWVGLVESHVVSLGAWLALSVGLTVSLRGMVQRLSKPEREFGSTDEDVDAFGTLVEVTAEVSDASDAGRIRFRGTSWPARSVRGVLEPGTPVRIVHRDNLVWIVEPIAALRESGAKEE